MSGFNDTVAREVPWYRDLIDGSGAARGLDKDLRDLLIPVTRDRAASEALWARQGEDAGEQAPPAVPSVYGIELNQRYVLRGSDVRVTWDGLTPASSRVTVISPDGSEQIVRSGSSAAIRVTVSGPITLRLNNQGRIMDVPAGDVECFELPEFTVPRGVLPPVKTPQLPPVQIPAHAAAAIRVPVPRLRTDGVAGLQQQIEESARRAGDATTGILQDLKDALNAGRSAQEAVRRAYQSRPARPARPEEG